MEIKELPFLSWFLPTDKVPWSWGCARMPQIALARSPVFHFPCWAMCARPGDDDWPLGFGLPNARSQPRRMAPKAKLRVAMFDLVTVIAALGAWGGALVSHLACQQVEPVSTHGCVSLSSTPGSDCASPLSLGAA